MNKINQGEFEVFTSKEDAIEKFTQIQGVCREELATGNAIVFYCDADGKITITNPPSKSATRDNATNLYANVIERDGKTYISYNTVYSKTVHVMKYIALVIYVLMSVLGIVVAFVEGTKAALLLCALGTVLFVSEIMSLPKEKSCSPQDSQKLVKELEKRVYAVNNWDK